jgi:DNA invertase Pin-like site-specific DNA recombinase
MIIGYARTSTREQEAGFAAQIKELKRLGCERIFKEQVSSVAERPQLEKLLDTLRPGDKVVVTKLDRLARSVIDLGKIVERLQAAGANLQIVAMGVDTSTATGKLMLNVLGSVAQFEREMMLERQRDGIEKAKAAGKYKGRKAKFSRERAKRLRDSGHSYSEIGHMLGVTPQAVHAKLRQENRA